MSPAALIVIPINLLVSALVIWGAWRMATDKYMPVSPIGLTVAVCFGLVWIWLAGLLVCFAVHRS